jgi:hypothetical protein
MSTNKVLSLNIFIFFGFSYGLAQLRALGVPFFMFILCRAAKNEPRKRAKGSNTPWHPAVRHAKTLFSLIVAQKKTSSTFESPSSKNSGSL